MTALIQQQLFKELAISPVELKTKMIDAPWVDEAINKKQQIDSEEITLVKGKEVFKKLGFKI